MNTLFRQKRRNERILFIASGFLLFSIILMVVVLPFILLDKSGNLSPVGAGAGVVLAILIHLLIFSLYVKFTRESRRRMANRKAEYFGIGFLPLLFGLIYMDGALASLGHQETLVEAILMFSSTSCDLIASLMMIILYFLKPQQ